MTKSSINVQILLFISNKFHLLSLSQVFLINCLQDLGYSVNLLTLMPFGKYKCIILLVVSLLLSASVCGQAGKIYKYHFNGDLQKESVVSSEQNLLINYSISELNLESFSNTSGDFYKISIPGHNPTSVPGKPELPVWAG